MATVSIPVSESTKEVRRKSINNMFETYKSFARNKENLNGETELLFIERFARLLDDAIMHDNLDILSKEQLKMFKRYMSEADNGLVSNDLMQLDAYLGGL